MDKLKPINLGKYQLPNNVVNTMEGFIKSTRHNDVELGFPLCVFPGSNEITEGKPCSGTRCSISGLEECEEGAQKIGTFHTHPKGSTAELSIPDLKSSCIGEKVSCVGNLDDGRINCFVAKTFKSLEEEKKKRKWCEKRAHIAQENYDEAKNNLGFDIEEIRNIEDERDRIDNPSLDTMRNNHTRLRGAIDSCQESKKKYDKIKDRYIRKQDMLPPKYFDRINVPTQLELDMGLVEVEEEEEWNPCKTEIDLDSEESELWKESE